MDLEVETKGLDAILNTLQEINPKMAKQAARAAGRRAATAGRLAGIKEICNVYAIRSSDIKKRTRIERIDDGAVLHVLGPFENVKTYKARQNSRGLFVTIKRGNKFKVPRGFADGGHFMKREEKARLPIRGVAGPAIPQLFQNPQVMEALQKRAGEVFEDRLYHEIDHRLKG